MTAACWPHALGTAKNVLSVTYWRSFKVALTLIVLLQQVAGLCLVSSLEG